MNQRTIGLLALVAFVFLPILCMGGLLEHECSCEDELACTDEEPCNHEDNCADDPCSGYKLRGDELAGFSVSVSSSEPQFRTTISVSEFARSTDWVLFVPKLPDLRSLPYPPADLPLRR